MGFFDAFRSRRDTLPASSIDFAAHDRALGLISRGNALEDAKQLNQALELYLAAVKTAPDLPKAYLNLGNAQLAKGDPLIALGSYGRALELQPDYAPAHYNCGNARVALMQYTEAVPCYQSALAIDPTFSDAHIALGYAQQHLANYRAAVASYLRALELNPDHAEALNNLGATYISLAEYDMALNCLDRSIMLKPDRPEPYYQRALLHIKNKERPAAIKDLDMVLSINPVDSLALGQRLHAQMQLCDWDNYEQQRDLLLQKLEHGSLLSSRFPVLAVSDSSRHQLMASMLWVSSQFPPNPALGPVPTRVRRSKIRIGYFSMDFNNHPVAFLTAGIFECHARNDFEIYAFSYGPVVRDEMRVRLEAAFDHFIDISSKSALEIAQLSRHLDIDIAVDLAGHTGEAATGVFALRAAPIQINYLGFPASMGADYIDYMLVDHVTAPYEQRAFYQEKLVLLPFFQANDHRRLEPVKKFSRHDLGLPSDRFVFCCFNHSYKITPSVFFCWMRILQQVPESVLFIYADNDVTVRNLQKEAMRVGLDPQRLVFGSRLSFTDNLSRYLEADLFLDTFPFNAGTTASDALWAGVPVLTCSGQAFASRMATSLLSALELPELITTDLEAYEKQAITLARDPSLLNELRHRVQSKRLGSVLCDSQTFTRHLEQAYRLMIERLDAGLGPAELDLVHQNIP